MSVIRELSLVYLPKDRKNLSLFHHSKVPWNTIARWTYWVAIVLTLIACRHGRAEENKVHNHSSRLYVLRTSLSAGLKHFLNFHSGKILGTQKKVRTTWENSRKNNVASHHDLASNHKWINKDAPAIAKANRYTRSFSSEETTKLSSKERHKQSQAEKVNPSRGENFFPSAQFAEVKMEEINMGEVRFE